MKLTKREQEVLRYLLYTSDEISEKLAITKSTVKAHVHSLIGKLGTSSKAEALIQALKTGLIRLEELE